LEDVYEIIEGLKDAITLSDLGQELLPGRLFRRGSGRPIGEPGLASTWQRIARERVSLRKT